jgi:hypothetical protein
MTGQASLARLGSKARNRPAGAPPSREPSNSDSKK